jgi:type I restriction enzyme S subunit
MQQLFPAEGETVPKLRFPEFRDAREWEEKLLVNVASVVSGQSPNGTNYNDKGIGTPFYQGKTDFGDIYLNKPTKWTTQVTKLANAGDILLSVRAPVGELNICTEKICIGRGLASIQAKQNKWYLYYFLNKNKDFIVGNGGSIFDSINKEQIEKIRILIPLILSEQQKIAECLSSLDDLITAETQKLDTLKAHKKGLMQQLFPSVEEVKR